MVKERDRWRLPKGRFRVLISSSKEGGRAQRAKTSAVMTPVVRGSRYGPIKKRTKTGEEVAKEKIHLYCMSAYITSNEKLVSRTFSGCYAAQILPSF